YKGNIRFRILRIMRFRILLRARARGFVEHFVEPVVVDAIIFSPTLPTFWLAGYDQSLFFERPKNALNLIDAPEWQIIFLPILIRFKNPSLAIAITSVIRVREMKM